MGRYSYSQLADFKRCPRLYFYRWVERRQLLPRALRTSGQFSGILIAHVLDTFYRERWWERPEAELTAWAWKRVPEMALALMAKHPVDWQPGEAKHTVALAREVFVQQVLPVIRQERLIGKENYSEIPLSVVTPAGHELVGRIDLLIVHPDDQLTLLDGKMGDPVKRNADLDQLRFYALLVYGKYQRFPARMGYWWFKGSVIAWKRFSATSISKYLDTILGRIKRIEFGDSEPHLTNFCHSCDFKSICPEGREWRFRNMETAVPLPGVAGEVSIDGEVGQQLLSTGDPTPPEGR